MRNRYGALLCLLSLGMLPARATGQGGALADLPLHLLPAPGAGPLLAVILSGDGNWADLDQAIAAGLVSRGVAVVGLESRSYLTHGSRKDPATIARDLEQILQSYLKGWHRSAVVVIGYSRGAELAPFAVSRLPAELRRQIRLLALLAPATNASFTFHFSDLISEKDRDDDLPMLPELAKLAGTRVLCVYGTEEKRSLCPLLPAGTARVVAKVGGHHLDKDYAALAQLIVEESRAP